MQDLVEQPLQHIQVDGITTHLRDAVKRALLFSVCRLNYADIPVDRMSMRLVDTEVVDGVKLQGKLTKRLATYARKKLDAPLSAAVVNTVNGFYSRVSPTGTDVWFDVTKTFDWRAGEFGDPNSCYWGSKTWCKNLLEQYGAFAIRLYTHDGKAGLGRCWVVDTNVVASLPGASGYVLFNAYGAVLEVFAALLSTITGITHTRYVDLYNHQTRPVGLWINQNAGYVLNRHAPFIRGELELDMRYKLVRCQGCNRHVLVDRVMPGMLCEHCFNNDPPDDKLEF